MLVLIALLVSAVAVPLAARIESRRIDDTNLMLDIAQEKLLLFASRMGYFPCPADPADPASNGQEPDLSNHTTGSCPVWHGFLPAAALGWGALDAQGYARDAWGSDGNRIRYAVSNQTVGGVTNPFTRINGMSDAGLSALASAALFHVCGSGSGVNPDVDCGTAPMLASNAAVVIWSVGPNALTGGTSIDEAQNPNPRGGSADRIFVSRERAGPSSAEFDDLVRWIASPALIVRLKTLGMMAPAPGGGAIAGSYGTPDPND